MRIIRVFTGPDGQSHFEDLEIPETASDRGSLTELLPATLVAFRETPPGLELDFHPAPRRQLVLSVTGKVEIECGDGSTRVLGPGDALLADDTTGQGHISRDLEGPRRSVWIGLPADLDVSAWRVTASGA
jgi:hypothetical protein